MDTIRKTKQARIVGMALLLAMASIMPGRARADTWTTGQISGMEQYPNGGFSLRLGDHLICPELLSDWDRRFGVVSLEARGVPGDYSADGVKAMLAQALAAKLSGGTIIVFTVSSSGICWIRQINVP